MGLRKRLLWIPAGFLASLGLAVGVYVAGAYGGRLGNYPRIRKYGPYQKYDVAILYGGQSKLRAEGATKLSDYFEVIIPVSKQPAVEIMISDLVERGIPPERIIQPMEYSFDTLSDLKSGVRTVKERGLGGRIVHISGRRHLERIKMLNESLMGEESSDDGYLPVEDGFGIPFWKLPHYRDSDLAAWWACYRDARRVGR